MTSEDSELSIHEHGIFSYLITPLVSSSDSLKVEGSRSYICFAKKSLSTSCSFVLFVAVIEK